MDNMTIEQQLTLLQQRQAKNRQDSINLIPIDLPDTSTSFDLQMLALLENVNISKETLKSQKTCHCQCQNFRP
jgi:hypothetical protein